MTRRPALIEYSQRLTPAEVARPAPTLALKATGCADALDISLGTFLALVREKKMPKPVSIPGHTGLALYDWESVSNAWRAIVEAAAPEEVNEWDQP